MYTFLLAAEIILAVIMIVIVLLQPSKTEGFGQTFSGKGERFFSKNKSRTYEAMLSKLTVVISILLAIVISSLNLNL